MARRSAASVAAAAAAVAAAVAAQVPALGPVAVRTVRQHVAPVAAVRRRRRRRQQLCRPWNAAAAAAAVDGRQHRHNASAVFGPYSATVAAVRIAGDTDRRRIDGRAAARDGQHTVADSTANAADPLERQMDQCTMDGQPCRDVRRAYLR